MFTVLAPIVVVAAALLVLLVDALPDAGAVQLLGDVARVERNAHHVTAGQRDLQVAGLVDGQLADLLLPDGGGHTVSDMVNTVSDMARSGEEGRARRTRDGAWWAG